MDKVVLNTISTVELREAIHDELRMVLEEHSQEINKQEELLSRSDVAALFRITPQTVNAWSKKGILVRYEVESRVYFKRSEIEKALNARRR